MSKDILKILLVSPLPPPLGGIASWTASVVDAALKLHNVDIICVDTAVNWRSINNTYNERLPQRVIGGTVQAVRDISRVLYSLIKVKPRLIHLSSSGFLSVPKDIIILSLARVFGVRSILHCHFGRLPEVIAHNTWEWKMTRRSMLLADRVLVLDRKSVEMVSEMYPRISIQQIPNPIDMKMVTDVNSQGMREKVVTGTCRIVFAGHVVPAKGVRELVHACLLMESHQLEVDIVGNVEAHFCRELESIAMQRNDGKWLRIHGALDRQEAMSFIRDADIFALPSYTEGFPNVVLEAMALGKPIVASRVGAIAEMLGEGSENPCGILIEPKNVNELHDAFVYFISNPEKAKFMGDMARAKAFTCYSTDNVMEILLDIWRSVTTRV